MHSEWGERRAGSVPCWERQLWAWFSLQPGQLVVCALWTNCSASLGLCFPSYKTGLVLVAASPGCVNIRPLALLGLDSEISRLKLRHLSIRVLSVSMVTENGCIVFPSLLLQHHPLCSLGPSDSLRVTLTCETHKEFGETKRKCL